MTPATPADSAPSWSPDQYLRYEELRARPLRDLLAALPPVPGAPAPRIADLGCGPGNSTALLARRWPAARITGYDNSPEMLERARRSTGPQQGGGRVGFAHADLGDWRPPRDERFGLILANAVLHWVPEHPAHLGSWLGPLAPRGVLAFQVPGNFRAPSHTLLAELCAAPRWRDRLGGLVRPEPVLSPAGYTDLLEGCGCEVDAWETTYHQLLPGPDPVLEWVRGTALRPVLDRLADDDEARDAFLEEYRRALATAYPPGPHGTRFPFRRVFVVARAR
ncbi:methyltransferase domain-containing protein [Streptomyces sp. JJ36]|uniref:methyltransferase domain-containing protein n=1 Tax=Streptomyces sp. JJ36 TaxID=2736645 RepID=UPI001F022E45|nr:methyltransferase domain-containing protein [Streptomyces sp. JJ36]MCF6522246.1 methyltransferase domain-containing protein [Streptomyces sp. JJ36]